MLTQRKELNFEGQNIYIGIDVHLRSWSVAILSENCTLKKFSQNPDPKALYKFLTTHYAGASYHSVYEAGFSGFWTHEELILLGINNIVVNAADVPTMMKEKLQKTDAIDCVKLARGLRSGELTGIYIPSRDTLEIRSLIRLRSQIVKDMTRDKNRIKAFLYFYGIKLPEQFDRPSTHWSQRFMQWLQSIKLVTPYGRKALDLHIKKAEYQRELLLKETKALRELARSERLSDQMRLITSVPGIGITIGISFLAEIGNIARFRGSDQLAAYIGLIPMCHSSGEKESKGEITIRKHALLRWYIIEAAWRAVRSDPAMTAAYEGYRLRMGANKAIVKIARRLINRIFFVLKRKQTYVNGMVG
jgi:Transposase and inactivated derivatives